MNLLPTRHQFTNFCIPSFSTEQRRKQNLLLIAIDERKLSSGIISRKMLPYNGPGDSNGDGGKYRLPLFPIQRRIEGLVEGLLP